jgi:hypothetical protein
MNNEVLLGMILGMEQFGYKFDKIEENNIYFENVDPKKNNDEYLERGKLAFSKMLNLNIILT